MVYVFRMEKERVMQDNKKRSTETSNTVGRELFVSMDADESLTVQMMNGIEEETLPEDEESPEQVEE